MLFSSFKRFEFTILICVLFDEKTRVPSIPLLINSIAFIVQKMDKRNIPFP